GIRADLVTGVQTCALPIYASGRSLRQVQFFLGRRLERQPVTLGLQPDRETAEQHHSDGHDELIFRLRRHLKSRREKIVALITSRSEEHTSELQSPDHLVCR